MPRGGYRHGYNWGVPSKDKTAVDVPREIGEEVKEVAQKLWEERKRKEKEENDRH